MTRSAVAICFASAMSFSLSGCFQSNQVKALNDQMDMHDKIEDRINKHAQAKVDVAPDWYIKGVSNSHPDLTKGVYGMASHFSKDMEIAFDDATSLALGNAIHQAKLTINMVKQSVRAGSGEDQKNVFNRMQEEIVKRTHVSGYKVEERDIRVERGGYRAFVKVFIPTAGMFAESEKAMIKQQMEEMRTAIKNDDDAEAKAAKACYDSIPTANDMSAGASEPQIEVIPYSRQHD